MCSVVSGPGGIQYFCFFKVILKKNRYVPKNTNKIHQFYTYMAPWGYIRVLLSFAADLMGGGNIRGDYIRWEGARYTRDFTVRKRMYGWNAKIQKTN